MIHKFNSSVDTEIFLIRDFYSNADKLKCFINKQNERTDGNTLLLIMTREARGKWK